MNGQLELASPVDDDMVYVDGLVLGVGGDVDVRELEEFFGDRKDRCDGFAGMINCLLYRFLALEEFVWH